MPMDGKNFVCCFRPPEPVLFQPLMPEAKSVAVPVEDFDDIPPAVAESKQMTGQGIKIKLVGNQHGQTVDRLAHIGCAGGDKGADEMGREQHYRFSRVASNLSKVAGENVSPTSTDNLPGRTTLRAARSGRGEA